MNHLLAKKISLIKPSPTLEIAAKASAMKAEGQDVINLSMGESDFDTPQHIKDAAIEAIKLGKTKYTAVDGLPNLKHTICEKFKRENQLDYSPSNISVGAGVKQVIFNALLATINPGDEVIIPAPYWVSYPDMVLFAGGTPVIAASSAVNNFKLSPEGLEKAITKRTKWLILNSPSNPTGAVYSRSDLKALSEILLSHPHVNVISDDIYEHLVFDNGEFYTIAQVEPLLKDRTLTVNGVSKSYAMTGWRIGYGAGHPELIKAMCTVQSQSTSNPCSISQEATIVALQKSPDPKQKATFTARRNIMFSLLNNIPGIVCSKPSGAFYMFPSCQEFIGKYKPDGAIISNCLDFADYLLDEAKVAVVPGSAFGVENFFRITYTTSEKQLIKACERISIACGKLRG